MPELRHLRVFAAVARERNFTRAAARLHMAQPAVSKTVAQLEAELGVELLERTTHDVALTPAGERLLADAETLVPAVDAAFARAREHGAGLAGELSIGFTPPVGLAIRYELARRLHDAAPALHIRTRELRPGEIAADLRERRVDAVLVRTARREDADVDRVELAPTAAALAVPGDHRLAARERIELRELDGERLLTWSPRGTPFTDLLVAACTAAGATVEPVETSVTSGTGLVELARLDAVAIVDRERPVDPGTRLVPIDDLRLPLLLLRRAGALTPAVARLIELLR